MYQICQSIPLWLQRNATGIGSTEPAAKQLVIRSGRAVPLLHFLMPLNVLLLMLKHVLKEIGHQEMKSLLERTGHHFDVDSQWKIWKSTAVDSQQSEAEEKKLAQEMDLKPELGYTFLLHGYFPCNSVFLSLNTRESNSLPKILLSLNSGTQAIGSRNVSSLTAVGKAKSAFS